MALEDQQALIFAGVAILAAIYIVRWKTHPASTLSSARKEIEANLLLDS